MVKSQLSLLQGGPEGGEKRVDPPEVINRKEISELLAARDTVVGRIDGKRVEIVRIDSGLVGVYVQFPGKTPVSFLVRVDGRVVHSNRICDLGFIGTEDEQLVELLESFMVDETASFEANEVLQKRREGMSSAVERPRNEIAKRVKGVDAAILGEEGYDYRAYEV